MAVNRFRYLDFDLQIEKSAAGFRADVLESPAGQASTEFALPFSELELENFLLRMGGARRTVRGVATPEISAATTFGGRLFEAVFSGEVRGCLRSSMDEARRQGMGLRVRLRLSDAQGVADLPWEYLYNSAQKRFLALSTSTPLVRYFDLPESVRPLTVTPPLRVLVLVSSPVDFPPLDVEREWQNIHTALHDLVQRGVIALERLETATLESLQNCLRENEFHIFHFIGHGTFNERTQDGELILEDAQGRGCRVSGQFLGTLLYDHHPLRLAILNACEGARGSATDPLAGTAQSLVQQGIPAVIAMQFEVSDDAAITFANAFYGALADRYSVDGALSEARKAIYVSGNGVEWGTPVLYMRSPDGYIFDFAAAPATSAAASAIPAALPAPSTAEQSVQPIGGTLPTAGAQRPQPSITPTQSFPQVLTGARGWVIAGVITVLLSIVGVWVLQPSGPPVIERRLFLANPLMEGDDVLWVQERLIDLGYLEEDGADGVFGPRTSVAVEEFQQVNDLEVDAIVGPITWDWLFSDEALPAQTDPPIAPDAQIPAQDSADQCTVLPIELNLRAGPEQGYQPLLQLQRGTRLRALERNAENTWIHVDVPSLGANGWVSANPAFISCAAIVAQLPLGAALPTQTPALATATPPPCQPDMLADVFQPVYDGEVSVRVNLGCAIEQPEEGPAVTQFYHGGTMYWWRATDTIFAFLGIANGSYQVFTASQTAAFPPPPAPITDTDPVRGFGRVYYGVTEIRATFGASQSVEHSIAGTVQQFQKGRMIFSPGPGDLADTVFVLYDNGVFESFAASSAP